MDEILAKWEEWEASYYYYHAFLRLMMIVVKVSLTSLRSVGGINVSLSRVQGNLVGTHWHSLYSVPVYTHKYPYMISLTLG